MPKKMALAPFTGGNKLRELLSDPSRLVILPGVFDGLTARLAIAAGFDAIYMVRARLVMATHLSHALTNEIQTGAGTSMSRLGWADLGLATLNDMVSNAAMIASLDPSIPLIADADTGYGGPVMVSRTVMQYARAGVAALHIEDQVQQKRCGHLLGKELVDRETYYARLRAAVEARDAIGSDMMIIARTDARQGIGFEEAVARLEEAVRIGVDVVFLEALQSKDEARQVCEIFKGIPCLLNIVPGGSTPSFSADEARELGFRLVIHPAICMEPMINAVSKELEVLKTTGAAAASNSTSIKSIFNLCGLQECIDLDQRSGGSAYSKVGK